MISNCGCDRVVEGLENCVNIDQNSLNKTLLNSREEWTDSDNPFGYNFKCFAQTEEKCNNMLDIKFNPKRPGKYNAHICRWNEGTCGKVETDNPNLNGPTSYARCKIDKNYQKCCPDEEANLNDQYPDGVPGTFARNINNYIDNLPIINNQDLSVNGPLSHITREVSLVYPEFSWKPNDINGNEITINGKSGRVFLRYGSDISRAGFNGEGKLYNIICPQLGQRLNFSSDILSNHIRLLPDGWDFGTVNSEVTVLKVRGFINETKFNADGCKSFIPDGKKHYDYTDLNSALCASTEPARSSKTGAIIPEIYECLGNNDNGNNLINLTSQKDSISADIEVLVQVWVDFTDSAKYILNSVGFNDLPDSKQNAVRVKTYDKIHLKQWRDETGKDFPTQEEETEWNTNNPGSMLHIRIRPGINPTFNTPDYTKHNDACMTAYLEATVGRMINTGNEKLDQINDIILNGANCKNFGQFSLGNNLNWNMWGNKPKKSMPTEFRSHKEMWVRSNHLLDGDAYRRGQTNISNYNNEVHPNFTDVEEMKTSINILENKLLLLGLLG